MHITLNDNVQYELNDSAIGRSFRIVNITFQPKLSKTIGVLRKGTIVTLEGYSTYNKVLWLQVLCDNGLRFNVKSKDIEPYRREYHADN